MPDLVSLEELKREIRVTDTADDVVLSRKLTEAQALVLDYVGQRHGDTAEEWTDTVAAWDEGTAPVQVVAAILELAAALARFRGDDEVVPDWYTAGLLPGGVRMKLDRLRDPALA